MVKKLMYTILFIIILFFSINMCGYTNVYAENSDDVIQGARNFLDSGSTQNTINTTELENTSDFVFNLLLAIATILAVVIGMIIGIQFMMAGVEEKAKIKELLLPYFVGCVVVFGAFSIWKLVVTILLKL